MASSQFPASLKYSCFLKTKNMASSDSPHFQATVLSLRTKLVIHYLILVLVKMHVIIRDIRKVLTLIILEFVIVSGSLCNSLVDFQSSSRKDKTD